MAACLGKGYDVNEKFVGTTYTIVSTLSAYRRNDIPLICIRRSRNLSFDITKPCESRRAML